MVSFELNGATVDVDADDGASLLDVLRDRLGVRSAKDGCSPQGQCGCCTVWIDGAPRVACVTPVTRAAGRAVTTVEGLADADAWARAFHSAGASQCGFCTPGIIMRLAALPPERRSQPADVERALLAHLCRCTGWRSIVTACADPAVADRTAVAVGSPAASRDRARAERRARLEGGADQVVEPAVALGAGGFADDLAPPGSLVAMRADDGSWAVAETVAEARRRAGKVPGRRTSAPLRWPVDVPPAGSAGWARTLQTTWVEPAYLEPDAAWCAPGGVPASPLGNGGAFGGKTDSAVGDVARRLADEHGRPVRALYSREDTVRLGVKRPPLAIGMSAAGAGVARLARPAAEADEAALHAAIGVVAPDVRVEFADVTGPPVSVAPRGAGWAEVAAALSSLRRPPDRVVAPNGAAAVAHWDADALVVEVDCGDALDDVVLRSYCVGAAHMALGFVRSEGLAVGDDGVPLDLTIRSFGILRAVDTPRIDVRIGDGGGEPVNGSDAVFAAVLAAAWRRTGFAARWPAAH